MAAAAAALLTALLAALAAAGPVTDAKTYPRQRLTMILYKSVSGAKLNYDVGEFVIPHGQCSGVLDQLLVCDDVEASTPLGVWVSVTDAAFPRVDEELQQRRGSVVRAPPCAGEAQVAVRLACAPQPL